VLESALAAPESQDLWVQNNVDVEGEGSIDEQHEGIVTTVHGGVGVRRAAIIGVDFISIVCVRDDPHECVESEESKFEVVHIAVIILELS
jgi:hypothetical protein